MCGILGIVGHKAVTPRLIAGLKRLEYRGYDSAGIAVLTDGKLARSRAKGKIVALESKLSAAPIDGHIGIAHTRWATHGAPTVANAHPHFAGRVGVVHNGIIENYAELRENLSKTREFTSETDTETIAHLIDELLGSGLEPQAAFSAALKQLRGAFAVGVIFEGLESQMFAARRGSPLAIGLGRGETYIGSDAIALNGLSRELVYMEEGDWAVITPSGASIFDADDTPVERETVTAPGNFDVTDKGDFEHFMLKEIYEQPETIGHTFSHYINAFDKKALPINGLDFAKFDRIIIIACGTASYAGHVAKYALEQVAKIPCEIDIASEFRYRAPVLSKDSLALVVSQSGETADTLAALRYCKDAGLTTAALVNVMSSTMAREADIALPIQAGPEIGVASTKAFTSQITALTALAILGGRQRGNIDSAREAELITAMSQMPRLIAENLELANQVKIIAQKLALSKTAFFLGRGAHFPLALEGALKLKEISYIHAEGYAAGELKHGPIALIEEGTPVIVIAPYDTLFEKTVSNMQEVASRGARIILITDETGAKHVGKAADDVLICPAADELIAPITYAVPIQLLAYYTALALGTDVDQPRNLAKSVTVE